MAAVVRACEADDHELGSRAPRSFKPRAGQSQRRSAGTRPQQLIAELTGMPRPHTTLSGLRAASTSRLCDGVALDPTEAPTLRDDIAAAKLVLVIKGAATRVRPRPLPSSIARPDG